MAYKGICYDFDVLQSIAPAAITATTTGSTCDCNGMQDVMWVVDVGVITAADASNYMTFKVQESTDDSTWTDLASANYTMMDSWDKVINLTTEGSTLYFGCVRPTKRYLRVVATETSTFNGIFGSFFMFTKTTKPAST